MSSASQDPESTSHSYLQLVKDLTGRYPILQYLNFFIPRTHPYPVRVAVLEFYSDAVRRFSFEGPTAYNGLQRYLNDSSRDTTQHRLFLVEDLDPAFIELLGSYLNVDGTVFASQIRDAHYTKGSTNGHVPKLPSFQDPCQSFTLRYYEARYFKFRALPRYGPDLVTAANVRRQIKFGISSYHFGPNEDDELKGHVGMVRRNTSFWSKKEGDGSWNGVMLLDPAIHDSIVFYQLRPINSYDQRKAEYTEPVPTIASTYQRGYRDFTPWPSSSSFPLTPEQLQGPQRTSLLDDICYYWQHVASSSQIASAIISPEQSAQFQLHIVASIWMNTLENIQALLSELETSLWALEPMIAPDLTDEAKDAYSHEFSIALNEVNTLRRRLNWYVPEVETNLFALGISPHSEQSTTDHESNFLAIYNRLVTYQRWSEMLLSVITTQVNLMETQKSISDSKSLSRLTILGFVFVPVSFVCSFFSMGGDFAVGENKFWIFFVVVVPLTLGIVALGFWKYWLMKFHGMTQEKGWMWPYRLGILRS